MKKQDIPNLITIIRLLLIIPLCVELLDHHYSAAFYILIFAGISDYVDGYLARHFGWQSKLGAIIDPVADKLLMLITYAVLTWMQIIPGWLFMLVIGRDIIIMLGVLLYNYLVEEPYYKASLISKINTTMQIIFVVLLLFNAAFIPVSPNFIYLFIYLVAFTTLSSLIDYVIIWGNRALKIWQARQI